MSTFAIHATITTLGVYGTINMTYIRTNTAQTQSNQITDRRPVLLHNNTAGKKVVQVHLVRGTAGFWLDVVAGLDGGAGLGFVPVGGVPLGLEWVGLVGGERGVYRVILAFMLHV